MLGTPGRRHLPELSVSSMPRQPSIELLGHASQQMGDPVANYCRASSQLLLGSYFYLSLPLDGLLRLFHVHRRQQVYTRLLQAHLPLILH